MQTHIPETLKYPLYPDREPSHYEYLIVTNPEGGKFRWQWMVKGRMVGSGKWVDTRSEALEGAATATVISSAPREARVDLVSRLIDAAASFRSMETASNFRGPRAAAERAYHAWRALESAGTPMQFAEAMAHMGEAMRELAAWLPNYNEHTAHLSAAGQQSLSVFQYRPPIATPPKGIEGTEE